MVCAPTNKAVTVVANRLLQAMGGENKTGFNIIMVGDIDKLLETGDDDDPNTTSPLQSIFIYTWLSNMITKYKAIRQNIIQSSPLCSGSEAEPDYSEMHSEARKLYNELVNRLPITSKGEIAKLSRRVSKDLGQIQDANSETDDMPGFVAIDELIERLKELPKDEVCRELLTSAHVIFCTLASAGAALFKWTSNVDDLIVDEASAATESELYIPFHLKPRRLMAVGDPMQLPATVFSRKAVAMGFDKSLHERLMNDLSCPYVMLDMQYRMKPEISTFPSKKFYQGKITDGENVLW